MGKINFCRWILSIKISALSCSLGHTVQLLSPSPPDQSSARRGLSGQVVRVAILDQNCFPCSSFPDSFLCSLEQRCPCQGWREGHPGKMLFPSLKSTFCSKIFWIFVAYTGYLRLHWSISTLYLPSLSIRIRSLNPSCPCWGHENRLPAFVLDSTQTRCFQKTTQKRSCTGQRNTRF